MSKKSTVIVNGRQQESLTRVIRAGNISSGKGIGVNPIPNHNLNPQQFKNARSWDQQRLF